MKRPPLCEYYNRIMSPSMEDYFSPQYQNFLSRRTENSNFFPKPEFFENEEQNMKQYAREITNAIAQFAKFWYATSLNSLIEEVPEKILKSTAHKQPEKEVERLDLVVDKEPGHLEYEIFESNLDATNIYPLNLIQPEDLLDSMTLDDLMSVVKQRVENKVERYIRKLKKECAFLREQNV